MIGQSCQLVSGDTWHGWRRENQMENQYKGFAYANESKPTVIYGKTVDDILLKLKSYNDARIDTLKFLSCNIGQLNIENGKYSDYHKYEVSTGKDISNIYLDIPSLSKNNFQKVISDLKKAGAQYNPYMKKWYVTVNQDLQKFQDICNQYSTTPKIETVENREADRKENLLQIEGVDIQYAVKMENQQTVMIPASELGIDPTGVTVGELIDKLGEKAAEKIHKDPETAVKESEYSISVNRNDNHCTVYYNDGRDPINLSGENYGLHFQTMEKESIADFVAEYMRRQENPDLVEIKDYQIGDTIECYVPVWTEPLRVGDLNKMLKPSQPMYVENIAHVIGTIQHIERYAADAVFTGPHMEYEVLDEIGKTHIVDSSEVYAPSQAQVLLRAAADELTAEQFDLIADRRLSSAQMEEIRFGFKDGLSIEQIALYAHPDMKPAEMDLCRIGLQKGLKYAEISNLLKETKELSWTDSRNRLNEIVRNQGRRLITQDLVKAEQQLFKDVYQAAEGTEIRMDIREDITESGFKPTQSLISNMEKLNAITGEHHKLKDVVKLYRENDFQNNHELSQTVLDIAEECKQQELSRMAEAILPG